MSKHDELVEELADFLTYRLPLETIAHNLKNMYSFLLPHIWDSEERYAAKQEIHKLSMSINDHIGEKAPNFATALCALLISAASLLYTVLQESNDKTISNLVQWKPQTGDKVQ